MLSTSHMAIINHWRSKVLIADFTERRLFPVGRRKYRIVARKIFCVIWRRHIVTEIVVIEENGIILLFERFFWIHSYQFGQFFYTLNLVFPRIRSNRQFEYNCDCSTINSLLIFALRQTATAFLSRQHMCVLTAHIISEQRIFIYCYRQMGSDARI